MAMESSNTGGNQNPAPPPRNDDSNPGDVANNQDLIDPPVQQRIDQNADENTYVAAQQIPPPILTYPITGIDNGSDQDRIWAPSHLGLAGERDQGSRRSVDLGGTQITVVQSVETSDSSDLGAAPPIVSEVETETSIISGKKYIYGCYTSTNILSSTAQV